MVEKNEKLNIFLLRLRLGFKPFMNKLFAFSKRNFMVIIAVIAAAVSCFFVNPDKQYLSYISYKTLACIFGLTIVMRGLRNTKIFKWIAAKILLKIHNTRALVLILVYFPALMSLLISNDVALITFIPFTIVLMETADIKILLPKVLILQTLAICLSGLLSPIGTAQNMYLYDLLELSPLWFAKNLWPMALVGYAIILVPCLTVKNTSIEILDIGKRKLPYIRIAVLIALTALTLLMLFEVVSWHAIAIIIVLMFIIDNKVFLKGKYSVLVMFTAFYILSGNLQRMPEVGSFITRTLVGREYWLAVILSQPLSNNPVAILLPQFTPNYLPLIVGINVGKFGFAPVTVFLVSRMYASHDSEGNFLGRLLIGEYAFLAVFAGFGYLFVSFLI